MMKRHAIILALGLVLALGIGLSGVAEELGEMELYDPRIYVAEKPTEPPAGEGEVEAPTEQAWVEEQEQEKAPEPEWTGMEPIASEAELRMGLGERYSLGGAVTNYQSDNPAVAAVDAKTGMVTAVALGSARITAQRKDGATVGCTVTVLNAPGSLAFSAQALTLGVGEGAALPAQLPEGTASASLVYASSNKSVVTVDASGNLTAKKAGTAKVAAKAFNGVKVVCKVTVMKAPSKVTLSAKRLYLSVGQAAELTVTLPEKTWSNITWLSSDEHVVAVSGNGALSAVGAGVATVRALAHNGKKADCKVTVLDGAAPTSLTLDAAALTLGVGEKFQLTPAVGAGEAALYAYASSDKKIAAVSSKGVIKPKRRGTATIGVATHNGLKATVEVTVMKAPSKVRLSQTSLTLAAGTSAQLAATLPTGAASAITWESSDVGTVLVDENGRVTANAVGTAYVRARTYNGKLSPACTVTVTPSQTEGYGEETPVLVTPTAAAMAARIRASALGAKADAIASVVQLMVSDGFEPAFAAGVGANIYSEGTYGLFESSKYVVNYMKRPRYFCYLDGGDYYTSGKLTAVYMSQEEMDAYEGEAEARLRFDVENYYLDNYSRKYVYEIDLDDLEAFMKRLDEGGWEGKFGVGIVQWTGGRTKTLLSVYRKHAGKDNPTITPAQVAAAENEMILYDFEGDYKGVYTAWLDANKLTNTTAAARSAGALVCTKYEIPVDKEAKAVVRGEKAVEIYKIMMGI